MKSAPAIEEGGGRVEQGKTELMNWIYNPILSRSRIAHVLFYDFYFLAMLS